jgi:peptidoglycan/LPS O-acetylase OafA/YrhL
MALDTAQSEAGFFCPAYVGLRCILLLAVLQGHYWFESFPHSRIGALSLAVPCFFALSGFLISHTLFHYERLPAAKALATFYIRRALRILPAYFLVLTLAQLARGVPYLVWHATYLLNFKIYWLSYRDPAAFSVFLGYRDFNAIHFWSVCVEEQFYLLYPLFVLGTSRRWRTPLLVAAIGLSIAARVWLSQRHGEAFYGGLPWVAGEYILWGCLLAWMDFRGLWLWLRDPLTLYGSLGALLYLGWHDESFWRWGQWKPPLHQTVYCLLIAALIASMRHNNRSLLNRFLELKPLRWVGKMSYGAYLVHTFLNPALDSILQWLPWLILFPRCPRAALGTVLTLGVAALLWYGFEKPIQGWRQRWTTQT